MLSGAQDGAWRERRKPIRSAGAAQAADDFGPDQPLLGELGGPVVADGARRGQIRRPIGSNRRGRRRRAKKHRQRQEGDRGAAVAQP